MKVAPLPPNEPLRLDALRRLGVLDTLPERAYDDIALLAAQICGTPIAVVSLVDADRQWFKARIGLEATETSRDVAFCAHAILEPDRVFVVPDALADPRFADNPLVIREPAIRFYAGAPLVTSGGAAVGALCVIDRVARVIAPEQEQALAALARRVVNELELGLRVVDLGEAAQEGQRRVEQLGEFQRLLEESMARLAEQSLTDPLTGARNRLAFEDRLEDEVRRHRRYGTPLALAMIDVDHFKEFNDRFGHLMGDEVLREVVRLISHSARSTDMLARIGGEEFALILPETGVDGAVAVAERLREAVAAGRWPAAAVTVSVGVAAAGEGRAEAYELMAAADGALYEAKRAGRNLVRVWGEGPVPSPAGSGRRR